MILTEELLIYSTLTFMLGLAAGMIFGVVVTRRDYESRAQRRDSHGRFTKKESSSS